jgi:hypothetical protein
LVKKEEEELPEEDSSPPVELNHFEVIHPKDDAELVHLRGSEEAAEPPRLVPPTAATPTEES